MLKPRIHVCLVYNTAPPTQLLRRTRNSGPRRSYEVFRKLGKPVFYVHPETDRIARIHRRDLPAFQCADHIKLPRFSLYPLRKPGPDNSRRRYSSELARARRRPYSDNRCGRTGAGRAEPAGAAGGRHDPMGGLRSIISREGARASYGFHFSMNCV